MAAGKLAALNISSTGVMTQLYLVPSSTVGVVTLAATNKAAGTALINVAITTVGSVTSADYILYQYPLPTGDSLEKPAIVLGAGQYIFVSASVADVNFVVYGFEDPA